VVCCVKFSVCGQYLATGSNWVATIYDVTTAEKLFELGNKGDGSKDLYIRSVVFSPDFKYLATGAEDRVIRVWEIQTQRVVQSFMGHDQEIYSLDWSRDGFLLVSGSGDRTFYLGLIVLGAIKVWDVREPKENGGGLLVTMVNSEDKTMPLDGAKEAGVTSVAINPLFPRCVASVCNLA
jgi:glucose repression regulatory protein TUP1